MTDSITQLTWSYSLPGLVRDVFKLIELYGWSKNNSLSLVYDYERDAAHTHQRVHGEATRRSIKDGRVVRQDVWYDRWIPTLDAPALKEVWEDMEIRSRTGVYRMRIMKLDPMGCLSFHTDPVVRYHIPIVTNPSAFFFIEGNKLRYENNRVYGMGTYHLPATGAVYRVDTRKRHTVYNGGPEPRIHVVLSGHPDE